MSKVICEKEDLVAIADATRQATGSTETYDVPSLRKAVINTFAQGVGGVVLTGQKMTQTAPLM